MGRELGLYGRGRAEDLFVESVEIFPHSRWGFGWINGVRIPFILTTGTLLLDIGADQAGIDREALAADQAMRDALGLSISGEY